ncbi:MAG: hypothetical protein AABY22_26890 [Nanoarchaeota archaeon]
MDTLILIALIFGGIVIFTGIIRIIFTPSKNMLDLFVQLFLLDWLGDLLTELIKCFIDDMPE